VLPTRLDLRSVERQALSYVVLPSLSGIASLWPDMKHDVAAEQLLNLPDRWRKRAGLS